LFAHFRDTKFTADACDFSKLRDTFPVISERKNIAVSMFLLMLVFSFVIGPLNYFVLKRKNRLVWILWTTPAIALLFTGGVIFRAVFAEGLASRVRMMSVTELDEASQTASTVAAVGYYCPLLPRGGLMFDQQTEITFLDKHHRMMPDFDWTKGQNIHNWIQPRTQGYILARKTEQRRERLKISKFSDDEIEIMNGTGARILDLKVMGRNGKEFSCDVPIDPGYQTRIKASPKQEHKFANTDALRNLFKHIPAVQPGGYMLRLERSPFIDPGMKPGELKEDCLVFGKTANDGSGI
jgi:hypothetical protein